MEGFSETTRSEWPPPSVWHEVDDAGRTWERLRAQGQELHFEQDAEGGRVVVQVRDLEGTVLRTLAPSEALSIAAGWPA